MNGFLGFASNCGMKQIREVRGLLIFAFIIILTPNLSSQNGSPPNDTKPHILAELACQAPPHIQVGENLKVHGTPDPVYKQHFAENEEVWVAVNPKAGDKNYAGKYARIYVVKHQDEWPDKAPLEDVSEGFESVQIQPGCVNGNYTRIWHSPSPNEEGYDVVVDFPPLGQYDRGVDILDNMKGTGFNVPEEWVSLEGISFNFDHSSHCCDAINLRKNYAEEVHDVFPKSPEWQRGMKSYPAAYIKDSCITINAVFSASRNVSEVEISAKSISGELGDIEKKTVTFKNGKCVSSPLHLRISGTTPGEIKSFYQEWKWCCRIKNPIKSSEIHLGTSRNKIYILLGPPCPPWTQSGSSQPWTDVLDKVCIWAEGEKVQENAARRIVQILYNDLGGIYDSSSVGYISCEKKFYLTKFLNEIPSIGPVDCNDMSQALVIFSNIVGCDLKCLKVDRELEYNCIKPIGDKWRCNTSFDMHAFAGIGCENADCPCIKIFDACFTFDSDLEPWKEPYKEAFVSGILFFDYKKELLKNNRNGIQLSRQEVIIAPLKDSKCTPRKNIDFINKEYEFPEQSGDSYSQSFYIRDLEKIVEELKENHSELREMNTVWKKDHYYLKHLSNTTYPTIRKKWKSEDNTLDITVVFARNWELAKKFLAFHYANKPVSSHPIFIQKSLGIGNICFVPLTERKNKDKAYSKIHFIRQNVLIKMWMSGNGIKKIGIEIAKKLYDNLENFSNADGERLALNKKQKTISFSFEKNKDIRLGEIIRIYHDLNELDQQLKELQYFWEITGGGIEQDHNGNLFYYASEVGKQKISAIVVDKLGRSYELEEAEISVLEGTSN